MEKVKVIVRMRPFNKKEKSLKCEKAWDLNLETDQIKAIDETAYRTNYTFDSILPPTITNQKVYKDNCKDLIRRSMEGIDTTIFVYGQTGAGKTHTILGKHKEKKEYNGIIFNSLIDIFQMIEDDKENTFQISVSYLEIYNELVYDLLAKQDNISQDLQVFEDAKNSKFVVKGKMEQKINSVQEGINLINFGEQNRTYAETVFNHTSSRSHTIFQVSISNSKIIKGEVAYEKQSVLNLVDLAGNERLMYENKSSGGSFMQKNLKDRSTSKVRKGNPQMTESKMNESKHINKSLFFLTQVIKCVSKNEKNVHIPFRNSPLTKILRSSFGGHSRTLLILCCAPAKKDFEISLSTLRFGKQAKKIENKIITNIKTNFNSSNFQEIIQSYEKKLNDFYNKLNSIEKEHRQNDLYWEKMRNLKDKLANLLLNFNTPEQRYNYLKKNKNKKSDIFHLKLPGTIFGKFAKEKTSSKCHQCSMRNFKIENKINSLTQNNNSDNDILEILKKGQEDFINSLKKQQEQNEEEISELKEIFNQNFDFIEKLIQQINELKYNILPYQDFNYINCLKASQVHQYEKEMRKLWEHYQEESVLRTVLKKNKIKKELQSSKKYQCLVIEEQNEFVEFKEQLNKNLDDFFSCQKENKMNQLKKIDFMKDIREKLKSHIDNIESEKFNLQKELHSLKQNFYSEQKINEKRLEFIKAKTYKDNNIQILRTQSQKIFKIPQKKSKQQQASDKSSSILFQNKDILGTYNLLNKKLYNFASIEQGLQGLKNLGNQKLKSMNQITGQNNNQNKSKSKNKKNSVQEKVKKKSLQNLNIPQFKTNSDLDESQYSIKINSKTVEKQQKKSLKTEKSQKNLNKSVQQKTKELIQSYTTENQNNNFNPPSSSKLPITKNKSPKILKYAKRAKNNQFIKQIINKSAQTVKLNNFFQTKVYYNMAEKRIQKEYQNMTKEVRQKERHKSMAYFK